jgi:Tfp pilus assembly protein PilF
MVLVSAREALVVLLAIALSTPSLGAQEERPADASTGPLTAAIAALENDELETARAGFEAALREAEGRDDRNTQYEALFYLGLLWSRLADATDTEQRDSLLAEAARRYERALAFEPRSGPALNNLAEVYGRLGRDREAERFHASAAATDDLLRPLYRRNFGDFLAARGEWRRAAEQYRLTLAEEPNDEPAHEALSKILRAREAAALPAYLWFLVEHGQARSAEKTAADALPEATNADTARALLVVLAAALAEQSYPPERFGEERPATEEALRAAVERADVGEGARDLRDLHAGQDLAPEHYRWWLAAEIATAGAAGPAAAAGQPPREVFRSLARSLAERELLAESLARAEDHFALAVYFDPRTPDLLAVRGLARVAARTGESQRLDEAAAHTEKLLSGVPPTADAYGYRHDLGILYSWLKQWGSERDATASSALFQLSRAATLADSDEDAASGLDARVYSYLVEGYVATGGDALANTAWLRLADAYRRHNHAAEADNLLAVYDPGSHRWPRALRRSERRQVFDDPPFLPSPRTDDPKPPN